MFIHSHKIETLEQESQLAQDIETSLKFSSKCSVIPKAREQPNPHTHTTRDPKGKFVVGESSRNTKGIRCFKCQDYGHVTAQCPSKNLLIKKADDDEIETIVYESAGSATDSDDDVRICSIQLGVVRCSHIVVRDEGQRRSSVFHIYITHEGKL